MAEVTDRRPRAPVILRVRRVWQRLVLPHESGLPNAIVFWMFPLVVILVAVVLTVLQINGTSSGVHMMIFENGPDPNLISGVPRSIRSDEWLVAQSWVISQAHHGYPAVNPAFPGGADMTVLNELPNWDWSSAFRPHMWGYLLLGVNFGIAWQWCLPAAGLIISCYWFGVALAPKRPITAATLAIAVFFAPFTQWWLTPSSQWALAWPLLAMAGVIWSLRDPRRWIRILWATWIGYFAVTLIIGLYVPFILPGLLVFLVFTVGYLLRSRRRYSCAWGDLIKRGVPLIVAGFGVLTVVGIWLMTRLPTVKAILSTVYPGQRLEKTGNIWAFDPHLGGIGGAVWDQALKVTSVGTGLGFNSSEASGVVLIALFLAPALVWFTIRSWRRERIVDWLSILVVLLMAVVLAYLFIPGWDTVAHLMFLDRIPAERLRIIFVVLLPVVVFIVIDRVDDGPGWRRELWPGLLSALSALGATAGVWLVLKQADPGVIGLASDWKVLTGLLVGGCLLLFLRKAIPLAAACLLATTLVSGWGVNPIYRGAVDLAKTTIGQEATRVDRSSPGPGSESVRQRCRRC